MDKHVEEARAAVSKAIATLFNPNVQRQEDMNRVCDALEELIIAVVRREEETDL